MTLLLATAATILATSQAIAQGTQTTPPADPRPTAEARAFSGRSGQLDVTATQVSDPDIQIDGRLDEAVWQQAAVLTDFTQYEPIEGIPATQPTLCISSSSTVRGCSTSTMGLRIIRWGIST